MNSQMLQKTQKNTKASALSYFLLPEAHLIPSKEVLVKQEVGHNRQKQLEIHCSREDCVASHLLPHTAAIPEVEAIVFVKHCLYTHIKRLQSTVNKA